MKKSEWENNTFLEGFFGWVEFPFLVSNVGLNNINFEGGGFIMKGEVSFFYILLLFTFVKELVKKCQVYQ